MDKESTVKKRCVSFHDAQDHAEAVQGGENHYYQISPGDLASSLSEIHIPTLSILNEKFSHKVAQYGAVPEGVISLVFPRNGSIATMGRKELGHPAAVAYGITSEYEYSLHLPEFADVLLLWISRQEWYGLLDTIEPQLARLTYRGQPICVEMAHYRAVLSQLSTQFEFYLSNPELLQIESTRKTLKHLIWEVLLDLHTHSHGKRENAPSFRQRTEVVRASREYLLAHPFDPVTVIDICQEFRISRRALQTCFLDVTGITPLAYLRALRLNEVKRILMREPRTQLSIGDAAAQFSFYHLSHFSAQYKSLFGELPSQTKRPG